MPIQEIRPENVEQQKVYLYPCSGRARLGIPRGHVYNVYVEGGANSGGTSAGFLSLGEAMAAYPNAKRTQSDSLCPSCADDIIKGSR